VGIKQLTNRSTRPKTATRFSAGELGRYANKYDQNMKLKVEFINLEEDDKDLIVSFAIDDGSNGINSLILHRQLFYEGILPDEERGVRVSLEDDSFVQEDFNMLSSIKISNQEIKIKSTYREYVLDISDLRDKERTNIDPHVKSHPAIVLFWAG
jgi:hypothetical protein